MSFSALHLVAERLASVTADTSFKVYGLTRLRIEPSLPASEAKALTTRPWRWLKDSSTISSVFESSSHPNE